MGIGTIMKAKKIVLMGWGQIKASVIQRAVEGHVTEQLPASLLQQHNDTEFVIDQGAASELTRFKSPWLTGETEWTPMALHSFNEHKRLHGLAVLLQNPQVSATTL